MADTTGRPMTPQDLTRIRFVSDPQISPDGQQVAFVVTMLSEDKDQYLSNIWMVDTAGGEPRRFTTGPKRDTKPRWSPDGTRLAFLSEREGHTESAGLRHARRWRGAYPVDEAAEWGDAACLVPRWQSPGLGGAGWRLAGTRQRGRTPEIQAGAHHHDAQV